MNVWIHWLPVNYVINKSIKHFDSSLVKLRALSSFPLWQEERGEISSVSALGEDVGCQRGVGRQPHISNTEWQRWIHGLHSHESTI